MRQEEVTIKNRSSNITVDFPKSPASERMISQHELIVRINGTLPDISTLGSEEKSERTAEIKRQNISTNSSCSLFARDETNQNFHMLVDVGQDILKSIEKGTTDLGFNSANSLSLSSSIPGALLLTHSDDDHVKELPMLVNKVDKSTGNLKIFCTVECRDEVIKKFPQLSKRTSDRVSFNIIQPDKIFKVGPFSVMPVLADHGNNSQNGSIVYIVGVVDTKIIIGWDFLSLHNADPNLFWKPDLLILGTQSYNPHPQQTGSISVSDAFELVRRWNAKECYIVQYSGLLDFEEASNQWFRGPVKAMTTDELQRAINEHLGVTGDNGKFRMTVAKEGMVWTKKEEQEQQRQSSDEDSPIGKVLEIESLQKYIVKIENVDTQHRLKLTVEDSVNRFNFEFVRPINDGNNGDIVYAQGVKGMMTKGPELKVEIVPSQSDEAASTVKIRAFRGKKNVFKDDILVSNFEAQRLKRFIKENFGVSSARK
jgi:transposase